MKKIFRILFISLLFFNIILSFYSCKKENTEVINNERDDKGKVVFWVKDDFGDVNVSIDGKEVGMISGYQTSGIPDCGNSKCLTITLEGGSHSYIATCHSGTFARSFTIISNSCNAVNIY